MSLIAFYPTSFQSTAFQTSSLGRGVARHGDVLNHTGSIISSATNVYCDGILVALLGDLITPHRTNPTHVGATIINSSSKVYANGKLIARLGDFSSCNGVINSASTKVFCEN
jgi:uncharacterized Zn-binding protein involved in type VI secretion